MTKNYRLNSILLYGIIFAEKIFMLMIMMVVVYGGIMFIQGSVGNQNIFTLVFPYFIIMSFIMIFVMQIINKSHYIPISISFSKRRVDTFLGLQWMNLIWIVQSFILFMIYIAIIKEELYGYETILPLAYILLLLMSGGIGLIISAISEKYGKVGGLVVSIIIALLIVIDVCLLAFLGGHFINNLINISLSSKIIISIASVLIYVIGSFTSYRILQTYEVRA